MLGLLSLPSSHLREARRAYKIFFRSYDEVMHKQKGPEYFEGPNNTVSRAELDKNLLYFGLCGVEHVKLRAIICNDVYGDVKDLDAILELADLADEQCRHMAHALDIRLVD